MSPILQLAVAAGLGFLVGLERQWAKPEMAGIRTFPLITVFGAISAMLSQQVGGWVLAGGLIAVTGMVLLANVANLRKGQMNPGLTTEMAILVMFGVGALLVFGYTIPAVATGGSVAVLLHWKQPLHGLVERIGEPDLRAILRLVLVALVILPLLPNRTYGPLDVLNPFQIWLMVVLIIGISIAAYLAQRIVGARTGAFVMGGLGGLISSTAATMAYARETKLHADRSTLMSWAILVAACVVFIRVLLELFIVAPTTWTQTAPPLIAMVAFMAVTTATAMLVSKSSKGDQLSLEAPTDLKAPIAFGMLYVVVLFLVAAAQRYFGVGGMYIVAALSGLTDMDALTLSTAQLINDERVSSDVGWRLIMVAAMANIMFKGAAVAFIGHRRLAARVAVLFGISLVGGVSILWFW